MRQVHQLSLTVKDLTRQLKASHQQTRLAKDAHLATHSLCNAHILRELNYVIDTSKAAWATEMKTLLLNIKGAVGDASAAGKILL